MSLGPRSNRAYWMEYCFAVAEVIPLRTTASNCFHSARSVGSSGCREVLRCDAGLPRRGTNLQPEEGVLQMSVVYRPRYTIDELCLQLWWSVVVSVVVQVWAGIHYEASLRSSRGDLCLQPRAGVLQMSVEVQLCPGIHYERWPRSTLEELCLQPEEGVLCLGIHYEKRQCYTLDDLCLQRSWSVVVSVVVQVWVGIHYET